MAITTSLKNHRNITGLASRAASPRFRAGKVGPDLRAGRFYSEVVSSTRAILTVRSEIGPYRRPSQCYFSFAIITSVPKEERFLAQVTNRRFL